MVEEGDTQGVTRHAKGADGLERVAAPVDGVVAVEVGPEKDDLERRGLVLIVPCFFLDYKAVRVSDPLIMRRPSSNDQARGENHGVRERRRSSNHHPGRG